MNIKTMYNNSIISFAKTLAVLSLAMLVACSPSTDQSDPFEGFNRGIYKFNEVLDKNILAPVAEGYVYVVPEFGRQRVTNVLSNLNQPWVMLNSMLQADPENAFSAFWSFVLNSTFGVAGIFDFAGENTSLVVRKEDFGQTLGVWGVDTGAYLVLPLFGPSNVRDALGRIVDIFLDPFNYANEDFVLVRTVISAIDTRAGLADVIDDVYENSFDPYATFRSGYMQSRFAHVENIK